MSILALNKVNYSYTNGKKILNNISMEFEKGKFYTILGVSGSGKTTLLSLLAGLDEPTGNLDSDTEDEIIEILKTSAHKHGKCVIVVTHSKDLASKSDVILELKDKKLVL